MIRGVVFMVCLMAVAWLGWGLVQTPDIQRAPGVLAPEDPAQGSLVPQVVRVGAHDVTTVASFDIRARVLSRKSYDDDLVPVDLALGWGAMSDSVNLDQMRIRQGNRTYGWVVKNWRDVPALDRAIVENHSANMHIIPANETVRKALENIRVGDIVRINGNLANFDDGGIKRMSSLARNDVGPGACEIIYAQNIIIEPRP